ncbi:probable RNA-dependent RNA polymerase 1 [Tanacetum coccineum]
MVKTVDVSGFPGLEPADKIKTVLEGYTGNGSIEALEVKQKNGGTRAYARVQFTTREKVDYIIELASRRRLWYGRSYLKVWEKDMDLVQKPRHYAIEMSGITLHFGCQVSKQVLSVLYTMRNASVKFGFGARKLYFGVTEPHASYKLQLSYENIWQVQFHRARGLTSSFLVIQILYFDIQYSYLVLLEFLRKLKTTCSASIGKNLRTCDDQWVRATDFTPSASIGQSSHLCLELSRDVDLNLGDYFPYYEESGRPFNLKTGHSFSQRSDTKLVPIVGPALGVCLPYNIVFKICALVQHGCIPGPVLDSKFYELLDPQRRDVASVEYVLEKLYYLKDCCYEPVKWITEEYQKNSRRRLRAPAISLDPDAGLVYVRRVQITPSKVYFCGPEINVSNRVLRHYSDYIDNFLRVSFVDEELEKLYSTDLSPRGISQNAESRTDIYKRILSILKDGIVIGGKKFEFLAFSSSQLRDNSAWMFAAIGSVNAASIREWMGDFSRIKNVAKYAARLGQSFGSSKESLSVERYEVEKISDVEIVRNGTKYVFSDGIGKISAAFAQRVSKKCGYGFSPSAFQIRYAGYKGVVAVDPTSVMKLSLRNSMSKFESNNIKLDILAISKYQPCYMNRQLITLLSTLGVRDYVFERKQKEAVDLLDAILKEPLKAQEALELMSPGENTNIMKEMLSCGYKPNAEPFLSMMLQVFRAAKLLEIRTKTRIFVPKGRSMMGCLDETRTLEYGQVFVQFSGAGKRPLSDDHSGIGSNKFKIVLGKVVVAKNPCLHPGDVRVLKAVNVPALHHMVDCVVFPQKGQRPHPNECSGSDLDGDIYFVCWDPDLIPPRQDEPMDYTPAPSIELDHDVTIEEVEEYFTNYIVNDSLGIIANAHTVFADREPLKAMARPCSTGIFMEKPDKSTYQSGNVIGKLFREVKDIAPQNSPVNPFTREVAKQTYDTDMEVDGFMYYVDEAFDFKTEYDYKLGNLMDYYGIKTEAELLSGSIMKMSRSFDRRNDAEAVGLAVKSLRKEARNWFKKDRGDLDDGDDDVYAKASAWYHVTYHPDYWGKYNQDMTRDHFLSFPWCIHDKLIEIKRRLLLVSIGPTDNNLSHVCKLELGLISHVCKLYLKKSSILLLPLFRSKIISKRIKDCLCDLVSINQSAFVLGRRISDNILLTQELMHNYHLDRGPSRCAFKVDVQIAYDTLDWDFLRKILIGDPLSPYSFTLVVDTLSHLETKVREADDFTFHHHCVNLNIINLCFANNLFLYAHGDVNSARVIMEALEKFKSVSGLVHSLPKSMAYFCNVLNHTSWLSFGVLPFEEGTLSVKYLGVPLVTTRLVYRDCNELVEEFHK